MLNPHLFLQQTNEKGWGVYTNKSISRNQIIEISPVIILSKEEKKKIDKTKLFNYLFYWDEKSCMAMGYIPIYNHSYFSNCEYFMQYEEGTIYIKTVRKINANEELTINYNGDWDNQTPVWFDVKK